MNEWPPLVPLALKQLSVLPLVFRLEAESSCRLPPYLGSTLRGGLAMAFRRMVCTQDLRPCDGCPDQPRCLYPGLFETPNSTGDQPVKRMRDIPHPVVVEPPLRHQNLFDAGETFEFNTILIGKTVELLPYLIFAVREMAATGLGVNRNPFSLLEVETRRGEKVYDGINGRLLKRPAGESIEELVRIRRASTAVRLILETPLRLKVNNKLQQDRFDPKEFFTQLGRRLWALLVVYHDADPERIDFRPLLRETPLPQVVNGRVRWRELSRYSNRQKSKLKMGGLVGEVDLRGIQEAWWPLLLAAEAVHVGKGTVMGLGQIRLDSGDPPANADERAERCTR